MKAFMVCAGLMIAACVEPRGALQVGEQLPLDGGFSGSAVVWVFDAKRCLGCTLAESAREIRRSQRRFGDRLELIVVATSDRADHARPLVNNFLRSERLNGRLVVRGLLEHAMQFGFGNPEPAVYIVLDGVVVHIESGEQPQLVDRIETILAES